MRTWLLIMVVLTGWISPDCCCNLSGAPEKSSRTPSSCCSSASNSHEHQEHHCGCDILNSEREPPIHFLIPDRRCLELKEHASSELISAGLIIAIPFTDALSLKVDEVFPPEIPLRHSFCTYLI